MPAPTSATDGSYGRQRRCAMRLVKLQMAQRPNPAVVDGIKVASPCASVSAFAPV